MPHNYEGGHDLDDLVKYPRGSVARMLAQIDNVRLAVASGEIKMLLVGAMHVEDSVTGEWHLDMAACGLHDSNDLYAELVCQGLLEHMRVRLLGPVITDEVDDEMSWRVETREALRKEAKQEKPS